MKLETEFEERGFVGPIQVLDAVECRHLARAFFDESPTPLDWPKGLAPVYRPYYCVATRPEVLDIVKSLLGDSVMLWGAHIVTRAPGVRHAFHTDLETSDPSTLAVSAWIGLRNVSVHSSLQMIPASHKYGSSLQEAGPASGGTGAVLDLARKLDPAAEIVAPEMTDGQAIFFDGRLWHGSDNTRASGARLALLLQYAAPGTCIRIPNLSDRSIPPKFFEQPKPACIMVHGSAPSQANRFQSGPADPEPGLPVMTTWVRDLQFPASVEPGSWTTLGQARGSSAILKSLRFHASSLAPATMPHEPHEHSDEEILLVLKGEIEILGKDAEVVGRATAGTGVYYPIGFRHTVRNPGPEEANYLMFKWRTDRRGDRGRSDPTAEFFNLDEADAAEASQTVRTKLLDRETRYLRRLKCHQTTLPPSAGYEPHVDAYDVAIVVLRGSVETLGETVGPGSVVFYAAGEPHGMRTVGEGASTYLVIEFRGGDIPLPGNGNSRLASLLRRARRRLGLMVQDHPKLKSFLRR